MKKSDFIFEAIASGKVKSMDEAEALWKVEHPQGDKSMEALVKVFIEDSDLEKDDLLAKASEASGYSYSTTNHMYNALPFAREYHKQLS